LNQKTIIMFDFLTFWLCVPDNCDKHPGGSMS